MRQKQGSETTETAKEESKHRNTNMKEKNCHIINNKNQKKRKKPFK